MLIPPFPLFACCAAAALANVAANPPFFGAGAVEDADVVAGELLDPIAGLAGAFVASRGLIGFAAVAARAVPLYSVVAAGAVLMVLIPGAFEGWAARGAAEFESVLRVFGLVPASPSSAFLFSVPGDATVFVAFATIVGFGFCAAFAGAGDFDTGVVADWPSLPTEASNAAN